MQRLMYLSALGCMFAGIQSGNFVTFLLSSLIAYVLMDAADLLEKDN
nr:MAG TPA: hypothetical protein [Caudoviricetes sp.]